MGGFASKPNEMKRNLFIGFIALLGWQLAAAQDTTKVWTLRECLDHALENNIGRRQSRNEMLSGVEDTKEARAALFPSLTASTSQGYTNYPSSQATDRNSYTGTYGIEAGMRMPEHPWQHAVHFFAGNAILYLLVVAVSVAIRMTGSRYKAETARQQLEHSRTEAELQNLKSQLNPHFLFNTLNNIYSLIQIDTSRAQQAVHALSRMLRYVLYDSSHPTVELMESYVRRTPFLQIEGSFGSGKAAFEALRECPVDLLYCDIQMPGLNGMDLTRMPPSATRVIFTTAFVRYAVEGFRANALDHLLKPISYADFLAAHSLLQ